jgi:glutathione S-transferase
VVRTPPRRRDPNAIREATEFLERYLGIAEKQLAKAPYLCGDDFTLADVQFGHLLYRYFTIEIERRERPSLRAYYERLVARPAYREHVMVSYDELRAVD